MYPLVGPIPELTSLSLSVRFVFAAPDDVSVVLPPAISGRVVDTLQKDANLSRKKLSLLLLLLPLHLPHREDLALLGAIGWRGILCEESLNKSEE